MPLVGLAGLLRLVDRLALGVQWLRSVLLAQTGLVDLQDRLALRLQFRLESKR